MSVLLRPGERSTYSLRGLKAVCAGLRITLRAVLRLRVHGAEQVPRHGPLILAANHSSLLDGPLVVTFAPRPVRAVAKAELYGGPLGWTLLRLGQIPVRRGRPDRRALRTAVAALREGTAVGMFPEGTRGSGRLESVQHGVAYLALQTGSPVLPVACVGTDRAMPKGSLRPRWRTPVHVVYGTPFQVAMPANPFARSALAAAAEEIRLELAAHLAAAEALAAAADPPR